MKNQLWRSIFLLGSLVLLVLVFGQKLGHRDGLLISMAMALSIISLFLVYGDLRLMPRFKMVELEGKDPWRIRATLETLADQARLPMPRVYVIEDEAPQTLALGRTVKQAKIFFTSGLLKSFDEEELRAILAYHLMCIRSRATVAFTIASALADAVLSTGAAVDWLLGWLVGSGRSQRRIQVTTRLVAPLAAAFVHIAVGRRPYLDADLAAGRLLGKTQVLARVLWKLDSYSLTQPLKIAPALSHFFMVNPLTTNVWGRYFHAQPQARERIQNLVGHYPL